MIARELSKGGIPRMLKSEQANFIVQVLQIIGDGPNYKKVLISDGYCFVKAGIAFNDQNTQTQKLKKYDIIQVVNYYVVEQKLISVNTFRIHVQYSLPIGEPVSYVEFTRKAFKNPKGSSIISGDTNSSEKVAARQHSLSKQNSIGIPPPKKNQSNEPKINLKPIQPQQKQANNSTTLPKQQTLDQMHRAPQNNQQSKGNKPSKQNQSSTNQNNGQGSRNNSLQNQSFTNQNNGQGSRNNSLQNKQNASKDPPHKTSKGAPNLNLEEFDQIKQLFKGHNSAKILARVLFVQKLQERVSQKTSKPFKMMSFFLTDSTGIIRATAFGTQAVDLERILELDLVYSFQGFDVEEDKWDDNKLCMKMRQGFVVKLIEQLSEEQVIPKAYQCGITVNELLEKDIGTQWPVVCAIKDTEALRQFTKAETGKKGKVKDIYLCDPEDRKQISFTLWNHHAELQIEDRAYLIYQVKIKEYNDKTQYGFTKVSFMRPINHPHYDKYIGKLAQMEMQNPHGYKATAKGTYIGHSLKVLKMKAENMDKQEVFRSTITFYLNRVLSSQFLIYLACPKCKKKIKEQNQECVRCNTPRQEGVPSYMFKGQFFNAEGTLIVSAFRTTQHILKDPHTRESLPPDRFYDMTANQKQEVIQWIRHTRIHTEIRTTNEQQTNGVAEIKHFVNKVIQKTPSQYNRELLKRIKNDLRRRTDL